MEQGKQWEWNKENLTSPSSVAKNILPGTKNYVRDELLGFDDFGRTAKYAKEGNLLGAVKSGLTGLGEIALTVGTAGAGSLVGKAVAKPVIKGAIKKIVGKEAAVQAGKKADSTAFKKTNNPFKENSAIKSEPKDDFVTKYENKAKDNAKAKEEVKAKEEKINRRKTFAKGAAAGALLAGGGDDSKNDPSKWKASAIV